MISGYCPWCGKPITVMAIFPQTHDLEWEYCKTLGCKGARLTIISNEDGFVIHPRHIRGKYLFRRPLKER